VVNLVPDKPKREPSGIVALGIKYFGALVSVITAVCTWWGGISALELSTGSGRSFFAHPEVSNKKTISAINNFFNDFTFIFIFD